MFESLRCPVALILLAACLPAQAPRAGVFSGQAFPRDAALRQDEPTVEDGVTGKWGVDLPTGYYFRGVQIENQGVIAQPYLELAYGLHAGEGTLRSVDAVFGVWNSLHDGPTGTGGGASAWYEGDFYAGLAVGLAQRWSASATYSYYASPNGLAALTEEAIVSLAFDDADLWGEASSGLQPAITLGFETKGQLDGGAGRGTYLQVAIEPGFGLGRVAGLDLSLALPMAVGFSVDDYYEDASGRDRALGFVDVGAVLSAPLPFVPSRMGPWTLSLSVHALALGSTPEALNGGDDIVVIGALGLSTIF